VKPFVKYVSRGALKLQKALDYFNVDVKNKRILDIGAGSGGFSEILLEKEAKEVVAIDVGYGQYSWKLRNDPRVKLLERTNIRHLDPQIIGDKADLAVIDLSFISVLKVIGNLKEMLRESADIIVLIKPQFEAGKGKVPKGGVIKDESSHINILKMFIEAINKEKVYAQGLTFSPIVGAKGNIEFLGYFSLKGKPAEIDIDEVVDKAHRELNEG
jgi:23S rRNA (cytidine1920-2'-O)/16S rRNA (cytidine1409-2'-O)-methyltransferase